MAIPSIPLLMSSNAIALCPLWLLIAATAFAGPGMAPNGAEVEIPISSRGPRWRVGVGAQWRSLDI